MRSTVKPFRNSPLTSPSKSSPDNRPAINGTNTDNKSVITPIPPKHQSAFVSYKPSNQVTVPPANLEENKDESSFLAISKSVRKPDISDSKSSTNNSPKAKSAFHSAQQSPVSEIESLGSSSPILAPDREIMHLEYQSSPLEVKPSKDENSATPASTKKEESDPAFEFARLPSKVPFTKKSLGTKIPRERSWLDSKPPADLASNEQADPVNENRETELKGANHMASAFGELKQMTKDLPIEPELETVEPEKEMQVVEPKQPSSTNQETRQVSQQSKSMLLDNEPEVKSAMADPEPYHTELEAVQTGETIEPTPSKSSLFRSKSKNKTTAQPQSNLFSATFGAFRKAKKLFFDGHEEKEKPKDTQEDDPMSPSKHKLATNATSGIPRSPLRSPSRNAGAAVPPGSPARTFSKGSASPSKPSDSLSRLMAPTYSSTAGRRTEQEATTGPVKKSLYPEIPKLFHHSAKTERQARSPSPDRHPSHFQSKGMNDVSMMAVRGSQPPSPIRQHSNLEPAKLRSPSPTKFESTIASKTQSATAAAALASESNGPKYGAPTPVRGTTSKLTKQPLVKRTNPTNTPGNTQQSLPVRVPMTAAREAAAAKPVAASNKPAPKQALTSMSLAKNKQTQEEERHKEPGHDSFATKFKAVLAGKSGKDDVPKLLRKPEDKPVVKPYKPYGCDSANGNKRGSDAAFGSPSDRYNPVKKPSFGPSSSLMKNAIMHQAKNTAGAGSKMPYMDGVKFSNDKIKFGPSSATTSISAGSTSYQRSVSNNSNASTASGKSSYASASSYFDGVGNQYNQSAYSNLPPPPPIPASSNGSGPVTPGPPSSTTVLPDIFSESEDDDDGSVILDWANSPELRSMLLRQQQVDPDSVFGPIAPLQMEEVFKSNTSRLSRFRPRSSSANWSGQDKLSQAEIERYAREMGYQNGK